MELTEKERLMLIKKKENICGATLKILSSAHDPKNILEIKKDFSVILSLLNSTASYSDSKNYDLNQFTKAINALFDLMWVEQEANIWIASPKAIDYLCNQANSIRFQFVKKKFKINIPKIDISIFRTG